MVVGTLEKGFEVVVIGGGPGGYLTAIRLAQLKKDVALIETSPTLGGVCLNEGCIPSKALIHAADFFYSAKKSSRFGVEISGDISVNLKNLMKWKDSVVNKLTDGVKFLVQKNGVELINGFATFKDRNSLTVKSEKGEQYVKFDKCIIATGSSPQFPDGFEPDGKKVLGPGDILSLEELPSKLIVIGGGYIGLEMSALFAKFGSKVTLIEARDYLLKEHDDEVRKALMKRFSQLNIEVLLSSKANKIERDGEVSIEVEMKNGEKRKVEGDKVLIALGRKPNSSNIGIEPLYIEIDNSGFIKVNDKMQTNLENVYAIGDVVGGPLLAHKAYREAKVAAEAIAGIPTAFDSVVIPAVIYSDPEIAWAGLSETEANLRGIDVITGTFPFYVSGRALTLDAPEGFVKIIAEKGTNRVLGVEIVGMDASELISEAALAIEMGAFLDDLSKTIHPHPSMSEALLESAEAALGEAVHILQLGK